MVLGVGEVVWDAAEWWVEMGRVMNFPDPPSGLHDLTDFAGKKKQIVSMGEIVV